MSAIADVFRREQGVLIAYLMGGDPTMRASMRAVGAAVRGGADMVELGVPFSDPIADGRTIQAAGMRALSSGATPRGVLSLAKQVKIRYEVPVIIMTYLNPINAMGIGPFLDSAKGSGVDGVIVPDLPVDEAARFGHEAKDRGVDAILLAAPTTSGERMRVIARSATGFVYLVSVMGVTGARAGLDKLVPRLVARARSAVGDGVPLAVGFGISRPEHVRHVLASGADAAIVGSAIVERVADNLGNVKSMEREIERYVRSMKEATRSAN